MSSDDDDKNDDFGFTRKIVLVAIFSLIAVVILVIMFNFYRKYRLKRVILLNRQEIEISRNEVNPIDPAVKTGIDESVIESKLPLTVYKQIRGGESIECSVCLSNLTEGAKVRVLPNCKHVFHLECIDKWLGSQTTCPVCRTAVEPRLVAEESDCQPGTAVEPTAPPLEVSVQNCCGSGRLENKHHGSSSSSQFNSFRRMLSRNRSSRKIASCGDLSILEDLERQP